MNLIAPDDRQFPNGPAYSKGDPVDVAALAEAIGHLDADALAADLIDQGWPQGSGSGKPPKVADVMKDVGDDPVKAQAALDAENATDAPRTGLVKKLEIVIAGDSASANNPPDEGDDNKETP